MDIKWLGNVEERLGALMPLETYLSPWLPTPRLGESALMGFRASMIASKDRQAQAPGYWFAADPRGIIAFARTAKVPFPGGGTAPSLPPFRRHDPREAGKVYVKYLSLTTDAFFEGKELEAGGRRMYYEAIASMVPSPYMAWVADAASEFLGWLTSGLDRPTE